MTMGWTEFLIIGLILVLVQVPCAVPVKRNNVGITVGKPLITLVGAHEFGKNDQENEREKAKLAIDSRLLSGSSSSGDDIDDVVLTDNFSKNYNASSSVSSEGGNKDDDVELKTDEDVVSPSTLTERLYAQLENQEAKQSGFHVEKDPSGREILTGPMEQAIANNNGTFEYQNKGQPLSSGSDEELPSPGRGEKLKGTRVEEQLLSDPLAKVTYVLNQGGVNPHHEMHTPPNEETTMINFNDSNSDVEKDEPGNRAENDVNYHGLDEDKMTSSNTSYDPESMTDGGFVQFQNPNIAKPLFNTTANTTKLKLHQSEMNREVLNQSLASGKAGLENSSQALNGQLPELVQSVVEQLGDKGSKFVSVELAKHPMIKKVWANAIAQALIKESDKFSQIDSGRISENISSVESDSKGISESLNDLSNLPKMKVQAEFKTKPSYKGVNSSLTINQMKESANASEEGLKGETKTKPSNESAESSMMLNPMKDPAHAVEDILIPESKTNHRNRTTDSPLALNQTKEPGHAVGVINKTPAALAHKTSTEGTEITKNPPGPSLQGNLKITSNNVQDSAGSKDESQLEVIKRPFNQVTHEDLNVQGKVNNQPYFVPKIAERLGSSYESKPILAPVINGFISNKEIPAQLEESLGKEQAFGRKPIVAPIASEFASNRMSPTRKAGIHEEQRFRNNPNMALPAQGLVSEPSSERAIDAPFLYRNFTRLDPDETKYLQLNLMSDPVAKEGLSDTDGPYLSQQQLQDEDAKEASYLEHQINDAGNIVGEILPSLNATTSKEGNSEASFISGHILGDPYAKAELAESFAGNNNLINAEFRANAHTRASVLNEDKKASNSDQHGNSQLQQRLFSDASHNYAIEEAASFGKRNFPYSNKISYRDKTKIQSDVGQMLLSPKTVSDISAVDLIPVSSLEGLQGAFNLNKPKTFMYQPQNDENDPSEFMIGGGSVANDIAQYDANPLLAGVARPQKKQLIHIAKTKHGKERFRKATTNLSSTPTVPSTPPTLKYFKTPPRHVAFRNKPTKSRDQPGTRESEISPTSVIFGLTANEMKELEKHLAHRPHGLGAVGERGSFQGVSPATKGFYDTKTDEEQEKSNVSMQRLVDRILKQRKLNRKAVTNRKAHTGSHKRRHTKLSPYKFSHGVNNKRDLESWESSTDVLNSDLDQIRGLSPKAQEDISNVIMKDYEGQQRHVKGMEAFPFDERDPSYAFERSLNDQDVEQARSTRDRKDSKRYSQQRRTLDSNEDIRQNSGNVETRKGETHKKNEFSKDDHFKDAKINVPVVKKGNNILNGDVIPLDDVRNDLAQGLLLETMRQESEDDLQYAKAVQKHDINRMRNMFQSAGDEIGIKRDSQGGLRPTREGHSKGNSKVNKLAEKRDISDWKTEFNDGTFRSPDFEKQLSNALKAESEHDLTYMNAVQDMDKQGFKMLRHSDDLIGTRRAITEKAPHQREKQTSTHSGLEESLAKSQGKLRGFLQNSKSNDEDDADEKHEGGGKGKWRTSSIQESVFRDLTPEGKVLSSDYKDLGSFAGSDAEAQLASVLQTANNGDQRDLKQLEKMDSADQNDVERLFNLSSETFKRSIAEKPTERKEGTIETIADIPDSVSKEKEINIVVSGDEEEAGWSAWSKCSKSCGNGGMKTRSLYCNKSSPFDAIVKCPGWNHQTVPCDVPKNCPVNGGFTHWTEWSICSESCGPKAVRMRMRLCTNPPPAFGGNDCAGWRFEVEYCKSKECPHRPGGPPLEMSKNNKQIIFKTLSATPIIEEISHRLPSTSTDSSNTAHTIARYSGLGNIDQEMAHVPSLQSLLNMQQQGNVRQNANGPNVFGFQEMPNLLPQFTGAPHGFNIPSRQLMSSMQFLKPGMGNTPQSEPDERYENGGKSIHVQGDSGDIGFTPWSEWTGCSASCGRGIKTRSRSCISAFSSVAIDSSCLGPKVQTKRCRTRRCPVDGHFSPWSDWSECSKTCGSDSYRKRERTCTDPPPRYGGEQCEGRSVERRHCLKPPCVRNLGAYNMSNVFLQNLKLKNDSLNSTDGFTEWGPWSQCSRTCGSNLLRVRKRSCFKQNNQTCSGSTSEVKPCVLPSCREEAISGFETETAPSVTTSHNISLKNEFDWSPWSACTKTCGVGSYRTRERTCSLSIPEDLRKVCIGSDIQKVPCIVPMCSKTPAVIPNDTPQQGSAMKTILSPPLKPVSVPVVQPVSPAKLTNQTSNPVSPSNASALVKLPSPPALPDPNYSEWSPWSKCSSTCGLKAVMYRERTCKLIGGKNCQGPNIQTRPCQFVRCPVHGGFSPWSQWSHCSVTCETRALKRRERSCSNPSPMFGGRDCEGERVQIRNCGTEACSVNGGLTGWTAWSACTKTCHTNSVSIRERYCTNPPPQGKGKDCAGQRMQARPCASSKCPVDGGLTAWSSWSQCRRCGLGERKRTRRCANPPPANGGKPCAAPLVQLQRCPVKHCKSSLGFGQWSSFGRCSRKCDGGIKRRRRRCRRPYKGCYGPRIQKRRCNDHRCPNGNYLVREDPVELCGYHPCKVTKCVTSPSAMCVSNSKCKPIFFNTNGRIINSCKGDSVVLSVPPERVCRFNPCQKSACFVAQAERCAVSYKCKPIFFGADGQRLHCRGILTVGAIEACGFDPCFEKACKVDLTARCVSDSDCKPTFISKTQRILDECVEDADDNDSSDEEGDETKVDETDADKDDSDIEDVSNDTDDDDDDNDDYDDEKHTNRHKKRKAHRKSENDNDDDDDAKETSDDNDDDKDDEANDDSDSSNSRKKNFTPVVNLSDESLHTGMVSGLGSQISFVSKHGPAKFYWLKGGGKGSKNYTEMLVIEAAGSRKSSVLFPPRSRRLKTKEKSKIQPKYNRTSHHLAKDASNKTSSESLKRLQ